MSKCLHTKSKDCAVCGKLFCQSCMMPWIVYHFGGRIETANCRECIKKIEAQQKQRDMEIEAQQKQKDIEIEAQQKQREVSQ